MEEKDFKTVIKECFPGRAITVERNAAYRVLEVKIEGVSAFALNEDFLEALDAEGVRRIIPVSLPKAFSLIDEFAARIETIIPSELLEFFREELVEKNLSVAGTVMRHLEGGFIGIAERLSLQEETIKELRLKERSPEAGQVEESAIMDELNKFYAAECLCGGPAGHVPGGPLCRKPL